MMHKVKRAPAETKNGGPKSEYKRQKSEDESGKKVESFDCSYIIFSRGPSVSLLTLVTSGAFLLSSSPALWSHPTEH